MRPGAVAGCVSRLVSKKANLGSSDSTSTGKDACLNFALSESSLDSARDNRAEPVLCLSSLLLRCLGRPKKSNAA